MVLGNMVGSAVGTLGGTNEIVSKIRESGIDLSSLAEMDLNSFTSTLEENGIDLSVLEGLGLSIEDVIEKIKENLA